MNPMVDKKTRALLDTAPDIMTRTYWLLKDARNSDAHPLIIARIEKILEARLFITRLDQIVDKKD